MNKAKSKKKNKILAYEPLFLSVWLDIFKDAESEVQSDYSILTENTFFQEKPPNQDSIVDKNMIVTNPIEYSDYFQPPSNQINSNNLYHCFNGILLYIYHNSNNKFNDQELEIHFSGAQTRKDLSLILEDPNMSRFNNWNILNIFDYENINGQFQVESMKNAFFGITFKRIKIQPLAYSIRSGRLTNFDKHLVSFDFLAYDEDLQKWVVLDERKNINDLIPTGGFGIFYVHSTKKSYSSFQIVQTDTANNGYWGFSISAFDIQGIVQERENLPLVESKLLFDEPSYEIDGSDVFFNYDEASNFRFSYDF